MSAIMSQNGRKMAKIMHNAAKKFDWKLAAVADRDTKRKSTKPFMMKHSAY